MSGKGEVGVKKKNLRGFWILLLAGLLAAVCTGCLFQPAENLFELPALPESYTGLQTTIEETMDELGAEYATINYGSNTSTIQLLDMDNDGAQETAVVFLRVTAAEERPLRVCLFRRGRDGFRGLFGPEVPLGGAAPGAAPAARQLLPAGTGRDPRLRDALGLVVNVAADRAYHLLHGCDRLLFPVADSLTIFIKVALFLLVYCGGFLT